MKCDLTDQELNEWVAIIIIKGEIYPNEEHDENWKPAIYIEEIGYFDPCNNLNHTHLMEEKIRDSSMSHSYALQLCKLIDRPEYPGECRQYPFELIHASARQRCEAAYLTFQEEK